MIGHLGSKVSALLDGRLTPAEEDRAWEHVHTCHTCRDLVEREGWVKTQLATLRPATCAVTDGFKSSLLAAASQASVHLPESSAPGRRGVLVLGSSAAGVAIMGIAALGGVLGPGAGTVDRRPPTMTNIDQPVQRIIAPSATPSATPTATATSTATLSATGTATVTPSGVTAPGTRGVSARPRTP